LPSPSAAQDNPSLTGLLETIKFSEFPLLESLGLQRTGVETRRGLAMLTPCRCLKYVDVSGCARVTGLIPDAILRAPGLRLGVGRSGLDGQDTVGNEARSLARWGKNDAARKPGGAPPT